MIADEVMAGFGRCGEWFAVDRWDVAPDLICFAKGVNSGYIPLGGVDHQPARSPTRSPTAPYPGGLTYSGHPLACASAVASINIFKEEGIIEHARHLGDDIVGPALATIAERHPSVGEVRGLGVFWAIELVRDRETREPLVPYNAAGAAAKPMVELAAACKQRGLWPFTHFNRMHVVPPITISDDDMRAGLAIIDEALAVADAPTPDPVSRSAGARRIGWRVGPPLPSRAGRAARPQWRDILAARSAHWALLDDAERDRLGELADERAAHEALGGGSRLRADRRGAHASSPATPRCSPSGSTARRSTASARSSCAPGRCAARRRWPARRRAC